MKDQHDIDVEAMLVALNRADRERRPEFWAQRDAEAMRAPERLGARPLPPNATIYFIGPAGGPIKIGWASRLEFRLRDLRLANAFPLEVWATVEGPPSLERDYHRRFKAHRLHGEWFNRAPEIVAEIERLAA